ncbi:MAG: GNAT family N-acetyltransferase [Bacteroidia bacterium]
MENASSADQKVSIKPLNRFNWEQATQLQLHDYQEDFLPSVLFSLAQSKFENLFPYGIFEGEQMVGFLMYGEFDAICWVSRFMIDKRYQEQGIGKTALRHLLDLLRNSPKCKEIRTSFSRKNALAEYFFRSQGFEPMGDGIDKEIVMRFRGR